MATVKVWNDNKVTHKEQFKGQDIVIPAGGFVEMDYIDAKDFQGQFTGLKMLGPGNPDPNNFKMIRVEEPAIPVVKEDPNVLHATGKSFNSQAELLAFARGYAEANPTLAVSDGELDSVQAKGPSMAEMQRQIEELKALVGQQARAKPGPKPKQRASA